MSLQPGETVPDFRVKNQDGNDVKLSDFKGKKVILYFYPKDNTPGCTDQACNLRDNFTQLSKDGYVILGISSDSERKHQNFIKKFDLPFTLLSDTEQVVHNLFGTWTEKQMFGRKYMGTLRKTFLIDEKGTLKYIISKVNTKTHFDQIIELNF